MIPKVRTRPRNRGNSKVERQDNPILREGLGEYLLVGRPGQPLFTKVHRIVSVTAKPFDDAQVHAHVGEESHASRLRRADFLACEPGSVFEGLLDVCPFQVRVPLENLLEGGAVKQSGRQSPPRGCACHGCMPGRP